MASLCSQTLFFIIPEFFPPPSDALINMGLVDGVHGVCGGSKPPLGSRVTTASWRGASQSPCALVGFPLKLRPWRLRPSDVHFSKAHYHPPPPMLHPTGLQWTEWSKMAIMSAA